MDSRFRILSGFVALANVPTALGALAGSVIILWVVFLIRRLYFHPLSKFPGPRLAAVSNLPYSLSYLGRRQPFDILQLHEKYGPVVRISPSELSFNTAQSWKDIYGQRKGHATFIKGPFYDGGNFADQAHSIVSERDPAKHAVMRKNLSSAFSDRSLREQEYLINKHINAFITRISTVPGAVDLTNWFNLLTFDIIGDLAFGQSFGGIELGKTNSWIKLVVESMGQANVSDTLGRFPWMGWLYLKLNPGWLNKLMAGALKHQNNTLSLLRSRLAQKTERKDFLAYLPHGKEQNAASEIQLAAHSSDFVIAGSETTASTLAVTTYHVCKDREILKKLQQEIRGSFTRYEDIDSLSTGGLRYLHAVCSEALRIFPPLPLGLPRVVPAGGDTVDGHYIPEGTIVSTNPLAASVSKANFSEPWKFDPDRWLSPDRADCLEASQPFSYGPRVCLGKALGWMELRVVLAKIHFKYDIELLDPSLDWYKEVEMNVLWRKPALNVKITEASR